MDSDATGQDVIVTAENLENTENFWNIAWGVSEISISLR